jgi:hypothetical protein
MSTTNLPWGKGQPVRKADNLTAICEQTVYKKCMSLDVSQPYWPPRPATGIGLTLPLQKLPKYFIFILKSDSWMRSEVLMEVGMRIRPSGIERGAVC